MQVQPMPMTKIGAQRLGKKLVKEGMQVQVRETGQETNAFVLDVQMRDGQKLTFSSTEQWEVFNGAPAPQPTPHTPRPTVKRGRPPKAVRTEEHPISVYLTTEQRMLIEQAAKLAGMGVSTWLRNTGAQQARTVVSAYEAGKKGD